MNKLFDMKLSRPASARLFGLAVLAVLLISAVFMAVPARSSDDSALPSAPPPAAETPLPARLSVYVVGKVSDPGVYEVEAGTLLCDLIEMCGGLSEDADADRINMVYRIERNCMINVGDSGESVYSDSVLYPDDEGAVSAAVNINTATIDELCTLPGIGSATARKIITYRETSPFASVDDLMKVSGIGPEKFAALKEYISVE